MMRWPLITFVLLSVTPSCWAYTSLQTVGRTGNQFAADIDSRFDGATTISPQFDHYTVSTLPIELNAQAVFVNDGKPGSTPCASGGTGAIAVGINGVFSCLSGVSSPYIFPQSYGASPTVGPYYNGAMLNSSNILTDTTDSPFSSNAIVGDDICVSGTSGTYGPSANSQFSNMPMSEKCGTIAAWTSTSQVTLSFSSSAGANQSGQEFWFGRDSTAAVQNAFNQCTTNGGGTVIFTALFAVTSSILMPTTVSCNILGLGSYAPDANYNNGGNPIGTGMGTWVATISLTQGALIYGGTSGNGASVQNINDNIDNFELLAGSVGGKCSGDSHLCEHGYFGTLAGGGSDGIWVHGWQHIDIEHSSVVNFKHDCLTAYGNPVEFIGISKDYMEYCGHHIINFSSSSYTPQMFVEHSELEGAGESGVFYSPPSAGEQGDTITIIGNTIQSNGNLNDGTAYDIDIEGGRYQVIMNNWLEAGGQGALLGPCHNSGGGDAFGVGSQLWIANHYGAGLSSGCDNIQQNVGDPLPTCSANFAGSRHWVTNGTSSPSWGAVYSGGGSTTVPVGCDGTNWRYGY